MEDIVYWISKIPRGERSFVYFACHGKKMELYPTDARNPIDRKALIEAVGHMKPSAVEFLHFGCCEMVDRKNGEGSLNELVTQRLGVRWVSGYNKEIDWLDSMFLDLALVAHLYLPYYRDTKKINTRLKDRVTGFFKNYEQLASRLGFSGVSCNSAGQTDFFPNHLHD